MAKARTRASTPEWVSLRDACRRAAEHFGSAELAQKMLFRRPKRYRALDQDDDAPVEGVSDFADMQVNCETSSALPAYSMFVIGPGSALPPRRRRLYRIELQLAEVLAELSGAALTAPPPRSARGSPPQHDREAIRAVAINILKDGRPPLKKTFYGLVRAGYSGSTPVETNNRGWNEMVGDLYDAAKIDSRRKG